MTKNRWLVPMLGLFLWGCSGASVDAAETSEGAGGSGSTGTGQNTMPDLDTVRWDIAPVVLGGGSNLIGVTICYEDDCEVTGPSGAVSVYLPKEQDVILTVERPGLFPTALPIHSGSKHTELSPLLFSEDQVMLAFEGEAPDPTKGHILQVVSGAGTQAVVSPLTGTGPKYGAAFDADPTADSIPDEEGAGYGVINMDPGDVTVRFENTPADCGYEQPSWRSDTVNEMRLPVVAGYLTFTAFVSCQPGEET